MKNSFLYKIVFGLIALMSVASCQDREMITINEQSAPIVMDLSQSSLFLDHNFPKNPALTITWSNAMYTIPVEIKYDVQMSAENTFKAPYVLASTTKSQTNVSFTNVQLNEAVKLIGLVPDKAQKVFFRVVSYIGSNNDLKQISNVTSLTITPYLASPTYPYSDLFLIGNSTPAGWDNNVNNNFLIPLLKDPTSPSKYSYTGYFKASAQDAGFKIIKKKGSWDAQYGSGGAGVLSSDGGSGNLTVPADGNYKLEIDIAAMTYTLVEVTLPAQTYSQVSVIGSVNGNWDKDTNLTQSTFDPHVWVAKNVTLKAGEFKFRANNSWDVNWGGSNEFFGTATIGGSNIPLSSPWNYDIYFNDASGVYSLIPVN